MRGIRLLAMCTLAGLLVCGWAGLVLAFPNPNTGAESGHGGIPPDRGVPESHPFLLAPGILEGLDLTGLQKVRVSEILQDVFPNPWGKSKDLMREFLKEAREKESPDPALTEMTRRALADQMRKEEEGLVKLYKVLNPEQRILARNRFREASDRQGMPMGWRIQNPGEIDKEKPIVIAMPGGPSLPPCGMETQEGNARRSELRKMQKEMWELAFAEEGRNLSLSNLANRASRILVTEILERERMRLGMLPAPKQVQGNGGFVPPPPPPGE